MTPETPHGWLETLLATFTAGGLGAWILRTTTRQARIEQKIDEFTYTAKNRMDRHDDGLAKLYKHITGFDLW